eukprot:CAMPEP_0178412880 /NCGR_PEP_ID=MMETSP0689_2-20121128/22242_1 /TAXON_ID=160604 /ORGANISM="Amphidinium massartii, Strain CS-259" /LENGTH=331 /DNA_ID=CAMNT_0020034139 /DNA_START=61 /DNA_END=1056 /DNA_ORIENTATION=+
MAAPMNMRVRRSNRALVYVVVGAFLLQFTPGFLPAETFAVTAEAPSAVDRIAHQGLSYSQLPDSDFHAFAGQRLHASPTAERTRLSAAAVQAGVLSKVINAMGAGAVASIIQAALSAVGEPIVNRVLVKRMKIMEAINDVSPSMMLNFFKTTLATNFLKFPFFEAINAFCACLPIPGSVRGFVTGFVFTSATLPVTNYRYRKSMDLEVNVADLYEAYLPTVIRDIVYGIARNYCTTWCLGLNSAWTAASPTVLFIVVILGCLISAPFNEWRGFLLQTKGEKISFGEFFKPANFIRSTSLGAIKQGLALAVGYWCAPPATKFVNTLFRAVFK